MPRVDPDDDTIKRFIVQHYRYDLDRHERRHVVVAAFDNKAEWKACIDRLQADLQRRRDSGVDVDPREYILGVIHEPGHQRRHQNARLLIRAARHGALPPNWRELDLPHSFALYEVRRSRLRHWGNAFLRRLRMRRTSTR